MNYLMLIEDNIDDCEAIIRGFKASGCPYPVKWFNNASDALDHLLDDACLKPSLIFTDLNIPGMDGRSLLKNVKSHEKLSSIPIIIFTTSSDEKDISYCYEHNVSSYIQKPIQFSKMKKICSSIQEYWFETCTLITQ